MGYGFGFLLSLVKLPPQLAKATDETIGEFVNEIISACILLNQESAWFPEIGVKDYAGSGSYGCGDQNKLLPELLKLATKFPDTIFAIYHYYWDYRNLDVYTFSDKGILKLDQCSVEIFKIGPYKIFTAFDFDHTSVPNNIKDFIGEGHGYGFDWIGDVEINPEHVSGNLQKETPNESNQSNNKELNAIKSILGMDKNIDYSKPENLKKLNYGNIAVLGGPNCDKDNITFGQLYTKYRHSLDMFDFTKEYNMLEIFNRFDIIANGNTPIVPNTKNYEIAYCGPMGILVATNNN